MSFLARRLAGATPSLSRSFSASARREVARITLVGNLGHAPTLKTTASGKEIVEYALATQDGSNVPSWFHVAAFLEEGPRRQFMMNLPKG
ncbi:hypothetical protein GGS20DRAFT_559630 [Poronia punctata]|nr:hypothetical protein GGS20DRAFT_559630 [Poronia punctata]